MLFIKSNRLIINLTITLTFSLFLISFYINSQTHSTKPAIQHATQYKNNYNVSEYWVSEKLDGVRGYWNGKALFTRNGHKIITPEWFTKGWPAELIDGELWSQREEFNKISSCVRRQFVNNNCWSNIKFMIFDLPDTNVSFTQRIDAMQAIVDKTNNIHIAMIKQYKIPNNKALYEKLQNVVAAGAEGLMLHHESAYYTHGRSKDLMKLKIFHDEEATVVAHIAGKGKYRNQLGSLLVEMPNGRRFKIGSGFSDAERKKPPSIGSTITYKYSGRTSTNLPRFATFLRQRFE